MNGRWVVSLVLGALALSSCGAEDLRYLIRAAYEEARILARRQAIDDVLAAGNVDEPTRAKIELAVAARTFAERRLGLDVGGSYQSIATVDQDQLVHVVSAAYRDRLQSYTWWFPIVGTVPYRGYFRRESAVALARTLEAEGYDTYVRQALAFSTLGYFDDPILSNFLRYEDEELVETILHELLHRTAYFSGQTAFNESFANFVGHRGAVAFFVESDRPEAARRARDHWTDARQFGDLLAEIMADLESAYSKGVDDEDRTRLFAAAQANYTERSWQTAEYDRFAAEPLNNAVLLARHIYFDRLELFEEAYRRFGEDLPRTIEWIIQASRSENDPFAAMEAALRAAP